MNNHALAVKGSLQESQKNKKVTFAEAFLTVDAICIVDISASMGTHDVATEGGTTDRWSEANRQLAHLQARYPGKLAIVAFSDNAEFCPSGVLPGIQGGTNLYGALEFVQPADGSGIKFIVVSDGEPDREDTVLGLAQRMESSIDTIFIGTSVRGRDFMERLSRATRGKSIVKGVELLEQSVTLLLGN